MTTPTNEPEETATPETNAAVETAMRNAPGTGSVFWNHVATSLRRKAESLELRAILAERERDELREMLERMTKSQEEWENGVETVIGRQPQIFTRVIDEARQLLTRAKPAQ